MIMLFCGIALFSSCNITKFLHEDNIIVDEVRIDIKGDLLGTTTGDLKQELSNFQQIEPNKKWRNRNYYKFKDLENPSWIRRWLKNKHSEPPTLLDTFFIEKGRTEMTNYLQNKKGFYQAKVDYEVKYKINQKSKVKYLVETGPRYKINSLRHISRDSLLTDMLTDISSGSLLKAGDPVEALTFDLEKQRIVSAFQKNGYADFNLTNVDVQGDSTTLDNAWDIFFIITPQPTGESHQKYTIGDINIFTDYHKSQVESGLTTEERYGKNYKRQSRSFVVKPSVIERKLYLNKYEKYDSDDYYKTVRNLFSLGAYKFAKLNPKVSPQDSSVIDYDIFLTPHTNKYSLDLGLESFFSSITLRNTNLVGIAGSVGIADKNVFGGSELFKSALELGVEFDPSNAEINTFTTSFSNSVEIPTLTKPFNIIRPLGKIGLFTDKAK